MPQCGSVAKQHFAVRLCWKYFPARNSTATVNKAPRHTLHTLHTYIHTYHTYIHTYIQHTYLHPPNPRKNILLTYTRACSPPSLYPSNCLPVGSARRYPEYFLLDRLPHHSHPYFTLSHAPTEHSFPPPHGELPPLIPPPAHSHTELTRR